MTFGQVAVMAVARQRETLNQFGWLVQRLFDGKLPNPFARKQVATTRPALSPSESISFLAGISGLNIPPKEER